VINNSSLELLLTILARSLAMRLGLSKAKLIVIFFLMTLQMACDLQVSTKDQTPPPNQNQDQGVFQQNALPAGRLCFVGNTGTNAQEQKFVARAMQLHGCKEIYHTGNIIYPKGISSPSDSLLQSHFFSIYQNNLASGARFHLLMGSVDWRGSVKSWQEISNKNRQVFFPKDYYAEIWSDLCIVAVDTINPGKEEQAKWFDKFSPTFNRCKAKIAFGHHAYVSPGQIGDSVGTIKDFLENRIRKKFDLYISGGDAILADNGNIEGTQFLISGGGGLAPTDLMTAPRRYAEKALGFVSIEYNQPSGIITYRMMAVDGTRGNERVAHTDQIRL